jgi:hypothetical protein
MKLNVTLLLANLSECQRSNFLPLWSVSYFIIWKVLGFSKSSEFISSIWINYDSLIVGVHSKQCGAVRCVSLPADTSQRQAVVSLTVPCKARNLWTGEKLRIFFRVFILLLNAFCMLCSPIRTWTIKVRIIGLKIYAIGTWAVFRHSKLWKFL